METTYYRDSKGILLRKEQSEAPILNPGDRFWDMNVERWATVLKTRSVESYGAPLEVLYSGTPVDQCFKGRAMLLDVGEIIRSA